MERTVLAYPKDQFSREQVIREKNKFSYPKAWRYDSKGTMHYLVLEPKLFERHYVVKKKNSVKANSKRSIFNMNHDWGLDV